jgi:hypothetical protein
MTLRFDFGKIPNAFDKTIGNSRGATGSSRNFPSGVFIDANDILYVADSE